MAPLDEVKVGERFDTLPTHVTIVPWFNMTRYAWGRLDQTLQDRLEEERFGTIVVSGRELFGAENETPVAVVAGVLFGVHAMVHAAAKYNGAQFDETYTGSEWQPHISGYDGAMGSHITTAGLAVVRRENSGKDIKAFYEWERAHEVTT